MPRLSIPCSTPALFANPPEGIEQGQKVLEMKKEKNF